MYTRNYVQEGGGIQLGKSDRKDRKSQEVDAVKWTDAEDIGIALAEKFPDVDPLTVRFTDLREQVSSRSTASTTIRRRRTSRSSKRSRWRGTRNGRTRNDSARAASSARACAATSSRSCAGVVLTASAFLPWVIVDNVAIPGVPDVWALWVAGLGAIAAVLAMLSLVTRKQLAPSAARHRTVRARHHVPVVAHHAAHRRRAARYTVAQAFAIVENRPVSRRAGGDRSASASTSGLAASTVLVVFGLTIVVKRASQPLRA